MPYYLTLSYLPVAYSIAEERQTSQKPVPSGSRETRIL